MRTMLEHISITLLYHYICSTCLRVDRECQVPWKTVQAQDCAVSITVLICRGPWSELPPELYLGFGLEEMQLKGSPRVSKISAMQAGSDGDQRTNRRPKHYLTVTRTHTCTL